MIKAESCWKCLRLSSMALTHKYGDDADNKTKFACGCAQGGA
jgi:hypothetical protein